MDVKKSDYLSQFSDKRIKLAPDAGVKIALGPDSGVTRHDETGKEFGAMVRRGITPLHALRSAAINAANLFGADEPRRA